MSSERLRVRLGDMAHGGPRPIVPSSTWSTDNIDGAPGPDESLGPCGGIRNYIVALAGEFKDGRGQFSEDSLRAIKATWPAGGGATVHAQHETIVDDRLTDYLGRAVLPVLSTALTWMPNGKYLRIPCVRATLIFDPAAKQAPGRGDMVSYFLRRCKHDPDSLSSSLVLCTAKRTISRDEPDEWTPTEIFSSDLVSVGAAVDGLLCCGPHPRRWLRKEAIADLKNFLNPGHAARAKIAADLMR